MSMHLCVLDSRTGFMSMHLCVLDSRFSMAFWMRHGIVFKDSPARGL